MDCTICGKNIKDGDTMYELNKGTWEEGKVEGEFIHEEIKGNYHETCLPSSLPQEDD